MTQAITSTADFDKLLAENTFVVVDFYADWCPPCKVISPIFDDHAAKNNNPGKLVFAKVNVDKVPELGDRYQVASIPTFAFIYDGTLVKEIKGANPPLLKHAIGVLANEVKPSL